MAPLDLLRHSGGDGALLTPRNSRFLPLTLGVSLSLASAWRTASWVLYQ